MIVAAFLKKVLGEFFSSWVVKGSVIFIALLVIFFTGRASLDSYREHQETKRQNTIGVLQNTNKDLAKTVDKIEASKKIDDKVLTEAASSKEKLKEEVAGSKTRSATRIATIQTKYKAKIDKAKTSSTDEASKVKEVEKLEKEQAVAISTAHLKHLWSAYCASTSQGATCGPSLSTV